MDSYIEDLVEFDYLLNEKIFGLRRKIGFYWYGKPEIIEQTNKHNILKKHMFLHLKNKYKIEYKVLEEYLKTDILNRCFEIYKDLSESDKNILQKYINSFNFYRNSFHSKYGLIPDLKFIQNEFQKITKSFEEKPIVLDFVNISDCAICMDSTQKINRITDCSHQFHKSCIDEWTKLNNSCPVCRYSNPIISKIEFESNC